MTTFKRNKDTLLYRNPVDDRYMFPCYIPSWLYYSLRLFGLVQFPCSRRTCKIKSREWYRQHPSDPTEMCKYRFEDVDKTCFVEYHTPIGISQSVKEVMVSFQPVINKESQR